MTNTTNYSQLLPSIGGSATSWGLENNNLHIKWDAELWKTLYLDGSRAMTGPLKAAAGTAAAPGLTFSADPDSGFYSTGANSLGLALGGANVLTWSATAVTPAAGVKLVTTASSAARAGLNLPSGAAPSAPVEGDLYYTGAALIFRGASSSFDLTSVGPATDAAKWTTARSIAFSGGDVTGNTGAFDGSGNITGVALSIAGGAVTSAKLAAAAVTTAKITDENVTLAKLQKIAAGRVLGNVSGAAATPSELAAADLQSLLGVVNANLASGELSLFGLHLKWGNGSVTSAGSGSGGELAVNFANAFPTNFQGAAVIPELPAGAVSSDNYAPYIRNPSNTGMSVGLDNSGGHNNAYTVYWIAWGR